MAEIRDVQIAVVDGTAKLCISFDDGRTMHVPLSEQIALVLNAGGWMMREHAARVFETDLNGPNPVSRRLRLIEIGAANL